MTMFGKILVVLTLFLSLTLATLAAGIVYNKLDWAGSGTAGERKGQQAELKTKILELQEDFKRNRTTWEGERAAFAEVADRRPRNQKWYKEQLKIIETGKDNEGKEVPPPAVRSLVYVNGLLKVDKDGLPDLGPPTDPRLKPQVAMKEALDKLEKEIDTEILETSKLIAEQEKITLELNGEMGKKKGLTTLLTDAITAQIRSKEEADRMRNERIDRDQEADVLYRRRDQLTARLDQLKKWRKNSGVATRE